MSKVVPSQVVALIDQLFPNAKSVFKFPVYSGSAASLSAIVSLARDIPTELIAISGSDYADLIHGLESLSHSVTRWNHRGGDDPPSYIKEKSPVAIVRALRGSELFAYCFSQSP